MRGLHLGQRPTTTTGGATGRITFVVLDDVVYLTDPISGYTFEAPVTFVGPTTLPSGLITASEDTLLFHYAGGTWSAPATQVEGNAPVGGSIINDTFYVTIASVTYSMSVTATGDIPGMPPGGDTSLVLIDEVEYLRIVLPTGEVRYEQVYAVPTPDSTGGPGGAAASDLPYDPVLWDGNLDAATKNVLRDKFESLPVPGGINALDYGLIPNDPAAQDLNKTAMLSLMAFAATRSCTDIYIPDGDYYINCSFTGSIISIPSGVTLRMGKRTKLIVDNNGDTERYVMLRIQNASHVLVTGGEIVGDKVTVLAGANYGYGISVGGTSSNVTIRDVVIRDCQMDGIIADGASDCRYENIESYGNLRHGGAMTIGRRASFVGCRFSNSVNYMAFDLEAEIATNVEDITFDRCVFDGSTYAGLSIVKGVGAGVPVRTRVVNCEFFNITHRVPAISTTALVIADATDFTVENCRFHDNAVDAIAVSRCNGGRISGCSIIGGSKGIYLLNTQGIDILDNQICDTGDDAVSTIADNVSYPLTNIKINGNLIEDSSGKGVDFRGTASQICHNRINRVQTQAIILTAAAENTTISGNRVSEASLAADNTHDALSISGQRHLICGNDVKYKLAGNQQRYGLLNVSSNSTIYGNETTLGGKTAGSADAESGTSSPLVPDDPYNATSWNGNLSVPTKNAVRDVLEAPLARGTADGTYSGTTLAGTAGDTIAFGDLVTLDKDDSRWEKVDISVAAAATGDARGLLAIAVTAGTDGSVITLLLMGVVRADANFPALTIGAPVYASTTGDLVVTQPVTVDHVIRIVGWALTADEIFFKPDGTWTTHT